MGDDGTEEATAQAQKLQSRVREAKQRAVDAKEQQENQRQKTKQVRRACRPDPEPYPQYLDPNQIRGTSTQPDTVQVSWVRAGRHQRYFDYLDHLAKRIWQSGEPISVCDKDPFDRG